MTLYTILEAINNQINPLTRNDTGEIITFQDVNSASKYAVETMDFPTIVVPICLG